MAIRYVTYDIEDGNSYDELYGFLEEVNAKEITKSTYKVDSKIEFDDFCSKLKSVTNYGDKVSVIFRTEKNILHKVIR